MSSHINQEYDVNSQIDRIQAQLDIASAMLAALCLATESDSSDGQSIDNAPASPMEVANSDDDVDVSET